MFKSLICYLHNVSNKNEKINQFQRGGGIFDPPFTYSIYSPGVRMIAFLFQLDKKSGCYGNLQLPLTYNGKSENLY